MPPEEISMSYSTHPSQEKYQHYNLNYFNITQIPEPITMRLGVYIKPPGAISMAYLISLMSSKNTRASDAVETISFN
jgi:hypothetical protein